MKVRLFASLALALPLAFTAFQANAGEAGFDYQVLATAQPKETKAKVEIIEFFSYRCPHCFQLEPSLKAWIAKQPASVKVIRQPVIFSDKWEASAPITPLKPPARWKRRISRSSRPCTSKVSTSTIQTCSSTGLANRAWTPTNSGMPTIHSVPAPKLPAPSNWLRATSLRACRPWR
ncbi:MAG: DsbA family protein [Hydrogenophilales bacterium]|nr:DsbA family protein [Hydrogenophilales bacterium]